VRSLRKQLIQQKKKYEPSKIETVFDARYQVVSGGNLLLGCRSPKLAKSMQWPMGWALAKVDPLSTFICPTVFMVSDDGLRAAQLTLMSGGNIL